MYFKGDIIITDPCYIAKNEKKETLLKEPEKKDFFSYESILDYPDVEVSIDESVFDFLSEKEINFLKTSTAKSRTYEKEFNNYSKAYEIYEKETMDDWEKSNYGEDMENIGLRTCITSDTLYGDWNCTTYEKETSKELGQFCADAGMVGVFLLDEVLAYNPDFKEYLKKDWVVTLIKDFEGEVSFETTEDELSVIGKGNINFYTKQTDL